MSKTYADYIAEIKKIVLPWEGALDITVYQKKDFAKSNKHYLNLKAKVERIGIIPQNEIYHPALTPDEQTQLDEHKKAAIKLLDEKRRLSFKQFFEVTAQLVVDDTQENAAPISLFTKTNLNKDFPRTYFVGEASFPKAYYETWDKIEENKLEYDQAILTGNVAGCLPGVRFNLFSKQVTEELSMLSTQIVNKRKKGEAVPEEMKSRQKQLTAISDNFMTNLTSELSFVFSYNEIAPGTDQIHRVDCGLSFAFDNGQFGHLSQVTGITLAKNLTKGAKEAEIYVYGNDSNSLGLLLEDIKALHIINLLQEKQIIVQDAAGYHLNLEQMSAFDYEIGAQSESIEGIGDGIHFYNTNKLSNINSAAPEGEASDEQSDLGLNLLYFSQDEAPLDNKERHVVAPIKKVEIDSDIEDEWKKHFDQVAAQRSNFIKPAAPAPKIEKPAPKTKATSKAKLNHSDYLQIAGFATLAGGATGAAGATLIVGACLGFVFLSPLIAASTIPAVATAATGLGVAAGVAIAGAAVTLMAGAGYIAYKGASKLINHFGHRKDRKSEDDVKKPMVKKSNIEVVNLLRNKSFGA